jgi:hypothetical protein
LLAPEQALVASDHALLPVWRQPHGPAISLARRDGILVGWAVVLSDVHARLCER